MPRVSTASVAFLIVASTTVAGCKAWHSDLELQEMSTDSLMHLVSGGMVDPECRVRAVRLLGHRMKWKSQDVEKVVSRKIWIGATFDQVKASWGRPRDTGSTVSKDYAVHFWHYGDITMGTMSVLTFEDGLCTGWSN